jgi:hypothetical protein
VRKLKGGLANSSGADAQLATVATMTKRVARISEA